MPARQNLIAGRLQVKFDAIVIVTDISRSFDIGPRQYYGNKERGLPPNSRINNKPLSRSGSKNTIALQITERSFRSRMELDAAAAGGLRRPACK
jgi:hypothetical protein